ncbi:hypothetical protein F4782DRAFT_551599 [Xylaria castorea]|nr:hypothetical protein F4782DRAFT_551599 [Xylaria castorea]
MAYITPEDRRGDFGFSEHFLGKKGTKIQVYVKVLEIETGIRLDKSKTIGTITTKNSSKILMAAHSGYSTGPKREDICLDTNKWNYLALHNIARQIKFKFPKNLRDNAGHPVLEEHRGRAHAGHVEVLLASWFVIHLLRREFDITDKSEKHLITQLKRLKKIDLEDSRSCFITIDSEPCRTCLQFINRLSQYTGIMFMVSGSRGIGPVKVRIDGQRRQDVVEEIFSGSEDEIPSQEANTQAEEATETTPVEDTAMPDIVVPVTPAPLVLRRPQSAWGKAVQQWSPEDPDQLLLSYKKKTPVYEFPGYDGEPRRDSETPSPSSRVQDTGVKPLFTSSAEEGEKVMHGLIEQDSITVWELIEQDGITEWEDLGDGLMICCKNTTDNNQEDDPVKCEQGNHSSPSPINESQGYGATSAASAGGNSYARAAYEVIHEMEYEVVESPRKMEEYFRNIPLHRPNRESASSSTRILRRLAPVGIPRLQRFRHHAIDDSDESTFKSRYSILNPRYNR